MTTHGLPAASPGFGVELSPTVAMQPALRGRRDRERGDDRRDEDEQLLHAASLSWIGAGSGPRRRSARIVAAGERRGEPESERKPARTGTSRPRGRSRPA